MSAEKNRKDFPAKDTQWQASLDNRIDLHENKVEYSQNVNLAPPIESWAGMLLGLAMVFGVGWLAWLLVKFFGSD